MSKDPAVLFYTQDFLTGTMLMTDEQTGKYIKLLCIQHQNGGLTEKEMLKICGKFDEDIFKKFELIEGKYYNKRMLLESAKRRKFTESRRANAKHMDKHMDKHMENENEDIIVIEKKEELLRKKEEEFKTEVFQFADKYPETMLDKFFNYWSEPNKSKTKMRYELEKTFEIQRRLITWAGRDKDFNKIIPEETIISHKELLRRFNAGETDIWETHEKVMKEGKAFWKLKKILI